jgi:hypothetical protein
LGLSWSYDSQWEIGLTLLAASGHSRVNGAMAVAFDKPAFDMSFTAGLEALGHDRLQESWRQGLMLTLCEAVVVATEDDRS